MTNETQIEISTSGITSLALDKMFPPIQVTNGELSLIGKTLSDPVVQKYLQSLARASNRELVSIDAHNMTDKEIADAHRTVSGRLETLYTLLSIEAPKTTEE